MFDLNVELDAARQRIYASIDTHAELVKDEIRKMAADAMKAIRRTASFDNRSAGQRKRRGQIG